MKSQEIRQRFLNFFEKRGHTILPSASLVPLNDPSILFTTAGMQPLVPYLLGAKHPAGKRLVNVQKCVRTQDIDEVGDNTHDTFFEMLGNWSLGDYFKKEAITWSWEFITSKEEGLGLDPKRFYVTVFEGDENAPRDDESFDIWKSLGVPEHRIYYRPAKSNWWSTGDNGPCGPDTEMFYDVTKDGLGDMSLSEYLVADEKQQVVEFWNDVFMEYEKKDGKVIGKLKNKNVDTGAGLERIAMLLQCQNNIFDTDLLKPLMEKIDEFSSVENLRARRIVADHIRTSVFMIADGVNPSNTDRGYVLRRLLRRAVRLVDLLKMKHGSLFWLAGVVPEIYGREYPNITEDILQIKKVIDTEEQKFRETLERGIKEFDNGIDAFTLFTTYGFPLELTKELALEKGLLVDEGDFKKKMKKHQDLSRSGSEQKFKGGLADTSEKTVRLHTAHHLLLRALQIVLGPEVHQRGSNITQERLRIDFSYGQKMTDEQKREVEKIVNEKILEKLPVIRSEISRDDAEHLGAEHEFGQKYPARVSVYSIGPKDATQDDPKFNQRFSIEFCGGPHVYNTSKLSHFRIIKEEAVAAGIRRVKGILE